MYCFVVVFPCVYITSVGVTGLGVDVPPQTCVKLKVKGYFVLLRMCKFTCCIYIIYMCVCMCS